MATGKVLRGAAIGMAALSMHAPGLAQQDSGPAHGTQSSAEADLLTEVQLLSALIRRRAEVARSAAEDKRHALDFLDRQIAQVLSRIAELRSRIRS